MLKRLDKKFSIEPIIEQVKQLGDFGKSIAINETNGKLLSGPYTVKSQFKNTPLGNVLDSIDNPGEARLLRLSSAETYTAHSDPDDRYHLAIVTNPFCFIINVDNKEMTHIPADGELWYMDTSPMHVAANFGPRDRIHLNIRVPLPKFNYPGYSLTIHGGSFDWKQQSYMELMQFFNKAIKDKVITGFEKSSEREVLLNCYINILEPFIQNLKSKGFDVELKSV